MALEEYRRKRSFTGKRRITEPRRGGRRNRESIYVVQLHHARSRHYDFRLEHAGTLKSWAIPKGPSLDPAVKRLAVEVEDHPIAYASFEGDIPEGHYGAGHVEIFDQGTWSSAGDVDAQLKKGHLHFSLHGGQLKGDWNLVRTRPGQRQPQWLLMKVADAQPTATHSVTKPARGRRARLPATPLTPELCTPADAPPSSEAWLHEIKWDGYRMVATIARGRAKIWSRNGIAWTAKLADIVAALGKLKLKTAQLDGELVAFDGETHSFNALKARLSGENQAELRYLLFDLPYLDGYSLADVPLLQRKQQLEQVLKRAPQTSLQYSAHVVGGGASAFEQALANGLEGVISKRADSVYRGGRVGDWIKTKGRVTGDFLVIGYTAPKGSRASLGSLLLGRMDAGKLHYAGRCGTGFSDELLRQLEKILSPAQISKTAVDISALEPRVRASVHWVQPRIVVEVYYSGIGGQGLLRHPAFKTIRDDRDAKDMRADKSSKRGSSRKTSTTAVQDAVAITHPERIVYPDAGITKAEVADYYRAVMPWLLPGIVDRPLAVVRCPDGITGQMFFQKHAGRGWGGHVLGAALGEGDRAAKSIYLSDAAGVLELVQMNVIEFHPWGARVSDPERADRIVFDLDPDAAVSWKQTRQAAWDLRELLDAVGLRAFLRTTGGKGLHVVVPLSPPARWEQAKDFAHSVARLMTEAQPQTFVDVAAKAKRKNRIFIDWLRNGRGATSVASYSLRAREGAPVAMPLDWKELTTLKSGDAFDLGGTLQRMRRKRTDPWAELAEVEQSLAQVLKRLAKA